VIATLGHRSASVEAAKSDINRAGGGAGANASEYLAKVHVYGDDVRASRGSSLDSNHESASPNAITGLESASLGMLASRESASLGALRIAFDSRPAAEVHGVGRYTRCLLAALREIAADGVEIVETHRPHAARARRVELFHTPWMEGAVLRSPCPMVVTLHDVDALTRRSERLRRGGVHMRLRHLALQRATHVIVHTEAIAHDALVKLGLDRERVVVIPPAPDPAACSPGAPDPPAPDRAERASAGAAPVLAAWSWEDVARATWQVYERALSEPPRPFISTRRAASARRGSS
jgi:hypothetical protein